MSITRGPVVRLATFVVLPGRRRLIGRAFCPESGGDLRRLARPSANAGDSIAARDMRPHS